MESYLNIPLEDISRSLLVSNVLFPPGCVNMFHTNFEQYIPPTAKDLCISIGSKKPNVPPQYLQMLYRDIALLGTLVLKLYVNAIQSPVHNYQIIKKIHILSPSGIKPATDVLSHNISVAFPT